MYFGKGLMNACTLPSNTYGVKHVQNLERDSRQEPSFHQRDRSTKQYGIKDLVSL